MRERMSNDRALPPASMPGHQHTPSTEERDPLLDSLQNAGMPREQPTSRLHSWAHAVRTFNWRKPTAGWCVEYARVVFSPGTEPLCRIAPIVLIASLTVRLDYNFVKCYINVLAV